MYPKPVTPIQLYGICGAAGAGKDSFAEVFHYLPHFLQYSFADPVKAVVCKAFGISPYNFCSRELKETVLPFWGHSPRELAQLVGTELFRNHFGEDHWIKRLEFQLFLDFDNQESITAVITDVRFPNEAQWILDNGGSLISLTRPELQGTVVGIPDHASEHPIDFTALTVYRPESITYIVNDSTLEVLMFKARQYIELYVPPAFQKPEGLGM